MSSRLIMTPMKAEALLRGTLAHGVGGPGERARLLSHDVHYGPGVVEIAFQFRTAEFGNDSQERGAENGQRGVLIASSEHYHGKAVMDRVTADFDRVKQALWDAADVLQVPPGWPCLTEIKLSSRAYSITVSPIFGEEEANAA